MTEDRTLPPTGEPRGGRGAANSRDDERSRDDAPIGGQRPNGETEDAVDRLAALVRVIDAMPGPEAPQSPVDSAAGRAPPAAQPGNARDADNAHDAGRAAQAPAAGAEAAPRTRPAVEPVAPAPEPDPASAPPFAGFEDPLLECLIILSALYDRPQSAAALRAGLPLVDGRLTPDLFVRAADRGGMSARLLRRQLRDISPLSLPCVLLLRDGRACVLVKIEGASAMIVMPESGRGVTRITVESLDRYYLGYALFTRPYYRDEAHAEPGGSEQPQRWFRDTLRKFWGTQARLAVAAVFVNLFALALPLFFMYAIDRVLPTGVEAGLWVPAAAVAAVLVVDFLLGIFRGSLAAGAGRRADAMLGSRVFARAMNMRLDGRPDPAGVLADRIRASEALRSADAADAATALVDLPFVLLFVAAIWIIAGLQLAAPVLIGGLVVLAAGVLLRRPLRRSAAPAREAETRAHALLVESLYGLETLKSLSAEGRAQRDWEGLTGIAGEWALRQRRLAQFGLSFTALLGQLTVLVVIVVGVILMLRGGGPTGLTLGAVVAAAILAGRAMAPLGRVAGLLGRLEQAAVALRGLDRLFAAPVERPAGERFLHRPELRGKIEFESVTFRYPGQESAALEDVYLHIDQGERVGIIGRIGAGKSTIQRLVLGLYTPQRGVVRLDDADLRRIDPADLRRAIGYVPQDIVLFSGSVRENIALGLPFADDEAVLAAARVAGLYGFIRAHPMGLDMQVGERGEALSGGQRQAIAIARALVRDAPILLLDEPTSAMDKGTEDRFLRRLRDLAEGRTMLVITQRVSPLLPVDRLMLMDAGRIVADGPRDKVLESLARGRLRVASR